jgi:tRNA dimethylallyltransferase
MSDALPLVAILGPTASGKSALGVQVAARFDGEVIACDSTQLYRYFDIGTAKVTTAERGGIPHHLIDVLEPHELFTAGDYRGLALEVLERLRQSNKLPVFTAGTGLYLRALLEGLADAPTRSEELRARLRQRAAAYASAHAQTSAGGDAETAGALYLHRILARLDPASAARIATADTSKVIRAIEVCLESGRPMSDIHREPRPRLEGYRAIKIGLLPPRDALYARISERVAAMLSAGWLNEVRALVARSSPSSLPPLALPGILPDIMAGRAHGMPPEIPAEAKPFQFIGYSELRAHLRGEISLADAVAAIEQATRRYAKRQITWFRREADVQWFAGFGEAPETASAVLDYLATQLASSD